MFPHLFLEHRKQCSWKQIGIVLKVRQIQAMLARTNRDPIRIAKQTHFPSLFRQVLIRPKNPSHTSHQPTIRLRLLIATAGTSRLTSLSTRRACA
jgi:hypothetical protein